MGLNQIYIVNQEENEDSNRKGIHWIVASIFIVATMVGAGLVVLPKAIADSGLIVGLIVLLGGALISVYTGILLGENWLMMRKRWKQFSIHCRDPYPEMATKAMGTSAGIFVRIVLCVSQFGVAVVFLILASINISSLLRVISVDLSFCLTLPCVSVILFPLIMLESPKDFWQAAVSAALCTLAAIILLFLGIFWDYPTCTTDVVFDQPEIMGIFLSMGTGLFAFGGHSCFPTFQHDMTNPKHFPRVIISAYLVIVLMYLPVSVYAFLTYGNSLTDDVSKSIQTEWIHDGVTLLITLHVTSALIIVIAPVSHSFERLCHVPNRLCARRFLLRSTIWGSVLFIALSVPKFGAFLDLVGGSTMALLSLVFPPLFNMFLEAAETKKQQKRRMIGEEEEEVIANLYDVFQYTSKMKLFINLLCIVLGIVSGIAATTSAIRSIFSTNVVTPCYIRPFIYYSDTLPQSSNGVYCCGSNQSLRSPFFNGTCRKI